MPQDAQNKLREAPTVEEVAWLREREKSFSAAVDKMKQECVRAFEASTPFPRSFHCARCRYEEDRARSDAFLRKNEEAAAADRRKVRPKSFLFLKPNIGLNPRSERRRR